MNDRERNGLIIAATSRVTKKSDFWVVPSQTGTKKYIVRPRAENPRCTCVDYETLGGKCKHIYAVEFVIRREEPEVEKPASIELPVKKPKKTYAQDWPAYNAAQTREKDHFQALLHDLCKRLDSPVQRGRGRPRLPLNDALFAAIFKVYSTVSGRRFMCDLRESHGRGHIQATPCYNSIFNVFEAEETTPILHRLIMESALPLKSIESCFACDSSGFSTSRFARWYDHKYGGERSVRTWVKTHLMCGVQTNVITAVEIHGPSTNDSPQLPPMLHRTAERFNVQEVSADMGYTSVSNYQAIVDAGAKPFIPFKSNATDTQGGIWAKMFHYFNFNREEFLAHYHKRSNVETTFHMLKSKFGDAVRSKTDVAMKNEVLAKIVCHNVCCCIQSWYELGIEPVFSGDQK